MTCDTSAHDEGQFGKVCKGKETDLSLVLLTSLTTIKLGDILCFKIKTKEPICSMVEENMKFTIRKKLGKDQVSHSILQLSLSADKLTMKLEILLDEFTIYTVTVLLFGKNIRGSPLIIPAKGSRISVPIPIKPDVPILVEEKVNRKPSPAVEVRLDTQNSLDLVIPVTKEGGETAFMSPVKSTGYMEGMKKKTLRRPLSSITNTSSEQNIEDLDKLLNKMTFEDQTCPTKREELNPKIMEEVLAQPIVKICRDPETKEKIFIVTESELRDKVLFPVSTRGSTQYTSPEMQLSFIGLLRGNKPSLKASSVLENNIVKRCIGVCELMDNTIVCAETMEKPYKVHMFNMENKLRMEVQPQFPFLKPSACLSLSNGGFAILDDLRVQGFYMNGEISGYFDLSPDSRYYGLGEDRVGRIVIIQETRGRGIFETCLVCVNTGTGLIERRIHLYLARQDIGNSKCRFLSSRNGRFYVTDLGLNRVYIIEEISERMYCVGKPGPRDDCFNDPAGTAVDDFGNFIVADSKNHKLALYTNELKFVCKLELSPPTKRPSGICLSSDGRALLVLNLWGSVTLARYQLR
ncbi:uncharacterized protein LOC111702881 isoform X2 [Eurytemora carolleeae]|uniref:uncharacterized protein LOC111702881 isoform X2 n=1 Tax=Eurytemora carolleeae TaxID=1294199 RepID=UPI000C760B30|nr:uncharacterized protein LOC111702881 isoform X2 [Eurytemora carolleeae]|eukprot:XP_023330439.1 uncharacterized protein LOC111702881 isoform X2 [Eurytemora affinis]